MSDKLIVVREPIPNMQLARMIYEQLQADPRDHTVPSLAGRFDVEEDQVAHVLNNYGPDDNGGVEQRPEGQGGGWIPEEIAQQYRSEITVQLGDDDA